MNRLIITFCMVIFSYNAHAELKALMAPWFGNSGEGKAVASKLYITNVPCKDKSLIAEFKAEKVKERIDTSILIDEINHRFILGCYSHKSAAKDVDDVILLRWYASPNEKTWELPADLFLQPGSFGALPEILAPKKPEPKLKSELDV
jgi:hypothetical protein